LARRAQRIPAEKGELDRAAAMAADDTQPADGDELGQRACQGARREPSRGAQAVEPDEDAATVPVGVVGEQSQDPKLAVGCGVSG
jgi:hypothetical protein